MASTITQLRKIIAEELKLLREGEAEETAAKMANDASKLLKAIETFKSSATAKAKADMGKHLDEVEKMLKRIVASPMQSVDVIKPDAKKVTLKSPDATSQSTEKKPIPSEENVL
jgi:hypothetical protein